MSASRRLLALHLPGGRQQQRSFGMNPLANRRMPWPASALIICLMAAALWAGLWLLVALMI